MNPTRLGAAADVVVVADVAAVVGAEAVLEVVVAVVIGAAACRDLPPPSVGRHLIVDLRPGLRHRDRLAALRALRSVRGQQVV